MITITVKVPREMLAKMDMLVARGVYPNRSELIREGIRLILNRHLELAERKYPIKESLREG
ncbi:MAG: ribbon-helix-helix domain-containing protein [Candidatus Njordarchaeales archaeon]